MQFALSRYTNHKPSLSELTGILVQPVMQFWFLYALFLISLIHYLLRRCGLSPLGALVAFVIFWSTTGQISLGTLGPLYATRTYGIYFALGSVLNSGNRIERIGEASKPLMALIAIVGYGAIAIWATRFQVATPPLSVVLALCGITASIALAVLLSRTHGTDFIRVAGVYSLEIYVAHTIASSGIRTVLEKLLKVHDPSVHILLGTIGGLVLPVALSWLCQRYHVRFLFRFPRRRVDVTRDTA